MNKIKPLPETMDQRTQFYWDVFVTACEGGVNYWASVWDYSPATGTATLVDGDTGDKHNLSLATIRRGFRRVVDPSLRTFKIGNNVTSMIAGAYATLDAGDIDADLADTIVQVGLFNEIVYG